VGPRRARGRSPAANGAYEAAGHALDRLHAILGKPFPLEDVMRILELLRIFRTIANLPDFTNKEAVREWLISLLGIAQSLTDRTPNEADDRVVEFLVRSVANEKLFDPIYDLLVALLDRDDINLGASEAATEPAAPGTLAAEAKAAGIDPLTIGRDPAAAVLAIVEAVATLVKLIRECRGK
jgi:hypothetical protein